MILLGKLEFWSEDISLASSVTWDFLFHDALHNQTKQKYTKIHLEPFQLG